MYLPLVGGNENNWNDFDKDHQGTFCTNTKILYWAHLIIIVINIGI